MSADNGIYILETEGPEFRVAHLQAVENVDWDESKGKQTDNPDVQIKNAREMWANSKVFYSKDAALSEAAQILKDLSKNGFPCEYGISFVEIPRVFHKTYNMTILVQLMELGNQKI